MPETILSFISIDWIKPLYSRLKRIWEVRDKELDEIVDVFGDPRSLAKYYIQPDCQQHNPTDYDEDSIRSCVKSEIFKTINNFLGRDTIERDGRNQMFILADAGMGKTSLFLMLKLSQMLSFWPQGYDCLLLKLGIDTLDCLSKQKNKAKTVLLLDALDEDVLARGRIAERLQEILEASMNFRHVLISCRTQFFPDSGLDAFGRPGQVVVGAYTCPMVFISLFDDDQVTAYLAKRFPDPWHYLISRQVDPRREQAKTLLQSMQSLQFRPLLLAHIEDLLESEQTNWNSYTIYESMVKTWLRREKRKMDQQGLAFVPEENGLWAACRLVAVYLQSLGKRTLKESELADLTAKLPPIEHLQHLEFGGRSLLNRTSNKDYRFAHYSIQEFLVANAVCSGYFESDRQLCALSSLPLPILTTQITNFMRCIDKTWPKKIFTYFNWQELKLDQLTFRDRLKGGGEGPEMIIIPPSYSQFASQIDEERDPLPASLHRNQEITKPFALSQNIIDSPEFLGFSYELNRRIKNEDSLLSNSRPPLFIAFELFANWIADQTGESYRLPSRIELEYAAIKLEGTNYKPSINSLLILYDVFEIIDTGNDFQNIRFSLYYKEKYIKEMYQRTASGFSAEIIKNNYKNNFKTKINSRYMDISFDETLYDDINLFNRSDKFEPIFIIARDL